MQVHDNGHEMRNGEAWWIGFMPYDSKAPQVAIAIIEGERPYQTLRVQNHYPSELWILEKCNMPGATAIRGDNGKLLSIKTEDGAVKPQTKEEPNAIDQRQDNEAPIHAG